MNFTEVKVHDLNMNPMAMIGGEWMLLSAGNQENGYNGMTVSWGHMGAIWERPEETNHMGLPTAVVYLRPQRYTKEFVDREELFTLCVFESSYRKALGYLGSHSGRDGDKIKEAGLTPVFADGTTYYEEAKLVFVCRKLYHAPLLESGFVEKALAEANYPDHDFHEMYIGEIVKVLKKD